jgi:hypothetical protein
MNKAVKLLFLHPWMIPAIIFSILVFLGANMHPLWGDEAETALFARNILQFGLPKGWNGVNILGYSNGIVFNSDLINHISPWAQYYLVAVSFLIFKDSFLSARLPFILLSIISIPVLYYLALKITRDKKIALMTVTAACLSVPFILFSFQARYYSLVSLFGMIFFSSAMSLAEKRIRNKLFFVLSGVIFYYGNYVSFSAFFLAVFFTLLIYFLIKRNKKEIISFTLWYLGLSLLIALFTLPWHLWMKPSPGFGAIVFLGLKRFFYDFIFFFGQAFFPFMENNGFPLLFCTLLPLIVIYKYTNKKLGEDLILLIFLPVFFLALMAAYTTVAFVETTFIQIRYTMLIFPYLLVLSSYVVNWLWQKNKIAGFLVFSIFVFTNFLTPSKQRVFLYDFVREIKTGYELPDEAVANYLKVHAKKGETVFLSLNRDHEPLMYELNNKVVFINRISLTNSIIFPKNRKILPRYIYDFRDNPDWIILYSKRVNDGSFAMFDYRPYDNLERVLDDYEETILPVYFSDMSRPELSLRSFNKITPAPNDRIFIYHKK